MVSLTPEVASFFANGVVEKRAASEGGRRGALVVMVRRKDIVSYLFGIFFAGGV